MCTDKGTHYCNCINVNALCMLHKSDKECSKTPEMYLEEHDQYIDVYLLTPTWM